ncbi:prestin-like isoform X2 [Cherax quadricarinatus]|uniref:prestin-like isoform X2 n=1 Tax=Cherax quadricarinatus TaxID=27406 RepID=UPI00387EDFA4
MMDHIESQVGEPEVSVVQSAHGVKQLASKYHYYPPDKLGLFESIRVSAKESCTFSPKCFMSGLTSWLPILSWLPSYDLRSYLLGDIASGITVAIMHIPQGMGYALLAELPPIIGIYMGFFPLLIYALLGTSRHTSMGSFAIMCLMTGKIVKQLAVMPEDPEAPYDDNITDSFLTIDDKQTYTPVQVAAIVALTNGFAQILLGIMQMGSLCVYLSDMMVSGFTTGASVHVLASQIPFLLGIHTRSFDGPLKIIYIFIEIFTLIFTSNPAVMVISVFTLTAMIFSNEIIKPWCRTITKLPIPAEFIVVAVGTLASYFGKFKDTYHVKIVGEIPTGLPEPSSPPFELLPAVAVDSTVISIVAYTLSISMARIFAKKYNYSIDANQELYAMGASNIFGSFFGCAPIAVSLARSLIQEAAGCMTQLTSLICCFVLVFVLLFLGPLFETLPNCVLSCIIVVALKEMFMQVLDLKKVWAISRTDALIWIVSFLSVVIIDIDYGLLIGIIISLLVLLGRSQKPKTARLGRVPNTDDYLDVSKHFIIQYLVIEMNGMSYTDSSGGILLGQLCKEYKEEGITMCLAAPSENVLETLEACGTLDVISPERIYHSVQDAVKSLTQHDRLVAEDHSYTKL